MPVNQPALPARKTKYSSFSVRSRPRRSQSIHYAPTSWHYSRPPPHHDTTPGLTNITALPRASLHHDTTPDLPHIMTLLKASQTSLHSPRPPPPPGASLHTSWNYFRPPINHDTIACLTNITALPRASPHHGTTSGLPDIMTLLQASQHHNTTAGLRYITALLHPLSLPS